MSADPLVYCTACRFQQGGQCHRHAPRPVFQGNPVWDVNAQRFDIPTPTIIFWPPANSECGEGERA